MRPKTRKTVGPGKVELQNQDSHFSTAQNRLRRKEKTAVYTKLLTHLFFAQAERGMIEVACMAHARRHIYQALDNDPP